MIILSERLVSAAVDPGVFFLGGGGGGGGGMDGGWVWEEIPLSP